MTEGALELHSEVASIPGWQISFREIQICSEKKDLVGDPKGDENIKHPFLVLRRDLQEIPNASGDTLKSWVGEAYISITVMTTQRNEDMLQV